MRKLKRAATETGSDSTLRRETPLSFFDSRLPGERGSPLRVVVGFDSSTSGLLDFWTSLNFSHALDLANAELATAEQALVVGNAARARVCARRAVGAFMQEIAPGLGLEAGTNALANLRFLRDETGSPVEVRDAAERLLGGARSILADEPYSADPLADARLIIRHYMDSAR